MPSNTELFDKRVIRTWRRCLDDDMDIKPGYINDHYKLGLQSTIPALKDPMILHMLTNADNLDLLENVSAYYNKGYCPVSVVYDDASETFRLLYEKQRSDHDRMLFDLRSSDLSDNWIVQLPTPIPTDDLDLLLYAFTLAPVPFPCSVIYRALAKLSSILCASPTPYVKQGHATFNLAFSLLKTSRPNQRIQLAIYHTSIYSLAHFTLPSGFQFFIFLTNEETQELTLELYRGHSTEENPLWRVRVANNTNKTLADLWSSLIMAPIRPQVLSWNYALALFTDELKCLHPEDFANPFRQSTTPAPYAVYSLASVALSEALMDYRMYAGMRDRIFDSNPVERVRRTQTVAKNYMSELQFYKHERQENLRKIEEKEYVTLTAAKDALQESQRAVDRNLTRLIGELMKLIELVPRMRKIFELWQSYYHEYLRKYPLGDDAWYKDTSVAPEWEETLAMLNTDPDASLPGIHWDLRNSKLTVWQTPPLMVTAPTVSGAQGFFPGITPTSSLVNSINSYSVWRTCAGQAARLTDPYTGVQLNLGTSVFLPSMFATTYLIPNYRAPETKRLAHIPQLNTSGYSPINDYTNDMPFNSLSGVLDLGKDEPTHYPTYVSVYDMHKYNEYLESARELLHKFALAQLHLYAPELTLSQYLFCKSIVTAKSITDVIRLLGDKNLRAECNLDPNTHIFMDVEGYLSPDNITDDDDDEDAHRTRSPIGFTTVDWSRDFSMLGGQDSFDGTLTWQVSHGGTRWSESFFYEATDMTLALPDFSSAPDQPEVKSVLFRPVNAVSNIALTRMQEWALSNNGPFAILGKISEITDSGRVLPWKPAELAKFLSYFNPFYKVDTAELGATDEIYADTLSTNQSLAALATGRGIETVEISALSTCVYQMFRNIDMEYENLQGGSLWGIFDSAFPEHKAMSDNLCARALRYAGTKRAYLGKLHQVLLTFESIVTMCNHVGCIAPSYVYESPDPRVSAGGIVNPYRLNILDGSIEVLRMRSEALAAFIAAHPGSPMHAIANASDVSAFEIDEVLLSVPELRLRYEDTCTKEVETAIKLPWFGKAQRIYDINTMRDYTRLLGCLNHHARFEHNHREYVALPGRSRNADPLLFNPLLPYDDCKALNLIEDEQIG